MNLNDLQGDALHKYLKQNKKDLISIKKSKTKFTDSISVDVVIPSTKTTKEGETGTKATNQEDSGDNPAEEGTLDVTVVCNTAWWCDSHMDVLTDDSYTKSIQARGTSIPHIADHEHTSTSHVGDVKAVYTKELSLSDLGVKGVKGKKTNLKTTALLMDTTIREDYNEDVYKFYKNGKINQHSIGLRYVELDLAINNNTSDFKEEKAVWDEYYPKVLNKDVVNKRAYFWVVKEVDVMENSCVLFGANSLTPTLSNSGVKTLDVVTKTDEPIDINVTIEGNKMTLEEAMQEIFSLKSQLETLQTSSKLEIAKSVQKEQDRAIGIIEAGNTFKMNPELVAKRIKAGSSVDDAVEMFEAIKQATQISNPTPAGKGLTSTVNSETDGTLSFHQTIDKALEQVGSKQQPFANFK